MSEYWLKALLAAETAEEQARRLRARWGEDAEARLEALARDGAPRAGRRERLDNVRRALRST